MTESDPELEQPEQASDPEREPAMVREQAAVDQPYERQRAQFRALIISNPNYFGNLKVSPFQPVLNIQGNTFYEEIGCVGFRPKTNRLDAVVYVKQPFGYGGDVCSSGTPEYVRFYMSFDNGVNWSDLGLTSFTAYDIPQGTEGAKRLEYAVSLEIDPPQKFCFVDNLALVRAILSWNVPPPPSEPDFTPVWGDVHETRIQIEPFKIFVIGDLLKVAGLELPENLQAVLDLEQTVPAAKPVSLSAVELQALYRDKGVEAHRFALTELQQLINQPAMTESLMASGSQGVLPGLDINLAEVVGSLFPTDGSTRYEELECVGLNTNQDTLVGVIRVKLPTGYSGDPCTAGSKEYVTFWADFNDNGTFETCLGTASVNVYDIGDMPKEGLEYAVALPIDLTHHRQPCEDGPKVVKIRAILSWQFAPPCGNPNHIPIWGNREETLIHITPGPSIPFGTVEPHLSILGGIPVSKIDAFSGLTTSDALFALNNLPADSLGRPCPFGGRVSVQGPQFFGFKYRVQVRDLTVAGPWTTVTTPLKVVDMDGNVSDNLPDPVTGLFEFLPFSQNIGNLLALWDTTGDHQWRVRLQIFTIGDVLLPGIASHRIQVDNTGPAPNPPLDPPTVAISIDSGGDCKDFEIEATISGHFVARDDYFGHFSLYTLPFAAPAGQLVPASGTVQTAVAPGDVWTLNTEDMVACGYVVKLDVADRSIVNSSYGSHHWGSASVGFCLREEVP